MNKTKVSFAELVREHSGTYLAYQVLLNTVEWHERRELILERDDKKCQKCGKWATVKIDFFPSEGKATDQHFWEDNFDLITQNDWKTYKPSAVFGDNVGFNVCGTQPIILADKHYHLEIHHRYYLRSNLPWQYQDEALITLCNHCHREVHVESPAMRVYPSQAARDAELRRITDVQHGIGHYHPCSRCGGTGSLPVYNHVQEGICFRCNGAGFAELSKFWVG